jgi:IMP dehydrogenase
MQSVSDDKMAVALAREGGLSFIYGSQSIEDEADMVARVKSYKAGYVASESNLRPDMTLGDVLALKERTGHSTVAVTEDGTCSSRLLGVVTGRDYRVTRMTAETKVSEFMTPFDKLITAPDGTTLPQANDIIWGHKLNSLPIISDDGHLKYFVFRKDYEQHKENPDSLQDEAKRYMVGAGINTRDYDERVPALVEAGADLLCIDSSEGFSEWQKRTLDWIKGKYGDSVKIGAGNVVDREGFRFLADSGADFIKVGIGGGSICITREQKGIGRGQATALIEVCAERDKYFDGSYMKEYWGEGAVRARNWQRYDLGGSQDLSFEEGVDSYVPYAGTLKENMGLTLGKIRSTMCNCGALSIPELQEKARLTLVSATSIVEGGAHDVILRDSVAPKG